MTPLPLHKVVERDLCFSNFVVMVSENLASKSDYNRPHLSWHLQVLNDGGYEHVFEIADELQLCLNQVQ